MIKLIPYKTKFPEGYKPMISINQSTGGLQLKRNYWIDQKDGTNRKFKLLKSKDIDNNIAELIVKWEDNDKTETIKVSKNEKLFMRD